MKIWVVGRGYPTTANRQWGSFELEQAKLLARNGHEVSYIAMTLSFFNREDPRGFKRFSEENVNIYTYSHFYFPGKLGIYLQAFEDRCWDRLLAKIQHSCGLPDVIHIHYPSMISSIHVIEKYRNEGVKIFVTEHWSRVLVNDLRKHELVRLKYYASCANGFLCVGEQLQEAVRSLAEVSVPMDVVPNLISPLFKWKDCKAKKEPFTFILVGRLIAIKQFDIVIRQFINKFGGNSAVKLKIIGAGSERKHLEKMSVGCSQIEFTGSLKLEEVAQEVAAANVLISYSRYETFSVPVIEAWACGKPVIISDRVGAVSYMKEELGIVVPYDSPEKLGAAMVEMRTRYEEYNPKMISEYARSNFCDAAIYDKLSEIYRRY